MITFLRSSVSSDNPWNDGRSLILYSEEMYLFDD